MLNYQEFELLKTIYENKSDNLLDYFCNEAPYEVFSNCNEVERTIKALQEKGLIDSGNLTDKALYELEECKVNNAIILAAGGAAKNSKSFYSLPKGLYVKNGEPLIERQIKQLQEAGIKDITVVLGYRQELFLYLEEKYGVKLANTPAIEKGNVVTLNAVKERLSRTYICSSDNYFVENPFSKYEYSSFHATVFKEDCTKEVQVKTNIDGKIIGSYTAKGAGECFYGHAFLDERFSQRLVEYLDNELDLFRVDMMFWEELAMRHIEDLSWYAHRYSTDFLYEFDSISETQSVETLFINDVSEKITSRICKVFDCQPNDITDIQILNKGMTNIIITFMVNGEKYLFRYPGESSWELTKKAREVKAQKLAMSLGLDTSCIYIDEEGCKICKFRDDIKDLSEAWWTESELVCKCAKLMRKLHDATNTADTSDMYFDPISEGDRLMNLAGARKGNLFETFGDLRKKAIRLKELYEQDKWPLVICHFDWKYDNILSTEECFDIIDWEYGGLGDPGADLLRLLMGREYDDQIFNDTLDAYFGHKTTNDEKKHVIAAFAPLCYYWLGWLMYQESLGNNGFYWTIMYYQTALKAIDYTLDYYEKKYD